MSMKQDKIIADMLSVIERQYEVIKTLMGQEQQETEESEPEEVELAKLSKEAWALAHVLRDHFMAGSLALESEVWGVYYECVPMSGLPMHLYKGGFNSAKFELIGLGLVESVPLLNNPSLRLLPELYEVQL